MRGNARDAPPRRPPGGTPVDLRVAVLIASKDGEASIAGTIRSVVAQADVYVVSDGSSDATAQRARAAGARVLELASNVGKPAALYRAVAAFGLLQRYAALAILDDDTTVAPDFIAQALRHMPLDTDYSADGVGIVVARTITDWRHEQRWNVWVATRAYAYWRYQATIRAGQNRFGVLNCISGSNSVYRCELLAEVLVEQTPYIVDDTYWVLETQRRRLGRVVYAPDAHAWVQDPTTGRDWYKQNLRWLWGSFQGVIGHRVGRHRSWFDFWYVTLIIDWVVYALVWPVLITLILVNGWTTPQRLFATVLAGYLGWITVAAMALRRWRLIALTPAIVAVDVLYRVNFLHAAVKAVRQPTVARCTWDSPARYERSAAGRHDEHRKEVIR